jgi:hypothetical protein
MTDREELVAVADADVIVVGVVNAPDYRSSATSDVALAAAFSRTGA